MPELDLSPGYQVPGATHEAEYEVKKSRFIAAAALAQDRQQAMEILHRAQSKYPDARHHCWAYLIGNPESPTTVAMSDDGEPGGTAGKPILNVLQHKGVGDIMLVVSRYFGGIKLGAGGLVRAYGSAAQAVMEQLRLKPQIPVTHCELRGGYDLEQPLRHWLLQHKGQLIQLEYGVDPAAGTEADPLNSGFYCQLQIPSHTLPELQRFVAARGATLATC